MCKTFNKKAILNNHRNFALDLIKQLQNNNLIKSKIIERISLRSRKKKLKTLLNY